MKRNELVDSLIANEQTKWEEKDRDLLMNTDMDILEKMIPVENRCSAEDTVVTNALEHTNNPHKKEEPLLLPKLDFGGQDEVTTNNESEDKDGPLIAPVMNFGKQEKRKKNSKIQRMIIPH